ncbi:MAG: cytidine deaminase [Planctomycetes bacterium B3_Pla]|nr:MAG: cytidine deaminase [Planctomycetes bacterium B3_Pla]
MVPDNPKESNAGNVPAKQSGDETAHGFTLGGLIDSELVIGLVGAVGTELDLVVYDLKERLQSHKYKVHTIHISKHVIPEIMDMDLPTDCDEYTRIDALMTAGNDARKYSKDNGVLSLGAAAFINKLGADSAGRRSFRSRHAYIIKSLKHPDEILQLRQIYPLGFYSIGVYAHETLRREYFVKKKNMSREKVQRLMDRDENENVAYGQHVSDTFHMSDFFVHLDDSRERLTNNLWRILDILFGHPYKTPTFDEYAMFLAHAAAVRSADLSRQVGAVIAKDKEILATGANDCPKHGGGLYWPLLDKKTGEMKDEPRGRDHVRGEDANKMQLQQITDEIIDSASEAGLDTDELKKVLDSSPIKDLTEFGRAVHAEMEALLSCARTHGNTRGATIYTTLFCCHNCAKHMIAAGITRVVYIEPYLKSKAIELHDDAISMDFFDDDERKNPNTMCFEPFVGVGPRRFFDLFSMRLGSGNRLFRKNTAGKTLLPEPEKGILRLQMLPRSYLDLEYKAGHQFRKLGATCKKTKE